MKKAVPVETKQVQKPEIKILPVQEKKATPPAPAKKAKPVRVKKIVPAPEKKLQAVKVSSQVEETKPVKPVIVPPVKVEKVKAEPVSREAKERAGKFTRMMERSDAYVHYRKNGINSKINVSWGKAGNPWYRAICSGKSIANLASPIKSHN